MITMSFADFVVLLSCLGAIGGVIFAAGRLSARVDYLEAWRHDMAGELTAIHTAIRHVETMIRGEET